MDEPLADPSAVALYFLSEMASKHVKVTLSGEGADELFGGYNIYKEPQSLGFYSKLPESLRLFFSYLANKLPKGIKGRGFLIRGAKTVEERYIGGAYIFSPEERKEILLRPATPLDPSDITAPYYRQVKHEDDVTKMQHLDINLWLVGDILLKADKMSMAHSLEIRVPFLDRRVFSTASRLPRYLRVGKRGTKLAFREAAKRHIPSSFAGRKKLGFPIPIRVWLREKKYYNIVRQHFESDSASEFFDTSALIRLLDTHMSGKRDESRKIWTVFMFLVWHGEFW